MKLIEKNNKKGITLIALVITIIVLLILAGVSISMLTGDNSLLGNAQKTGPANKIGAAKDEIGLAYNTAMQEYYQDRYTTGNINDTVTFASKFDTAMSSFTATNADQNNAKNHGCKVKYSSSAGKITIICDKYKVIGHVNTSGSSSSGITWDQMTEYDPEKDDLVIGSASDWEVNAETNTVVAYKGDKTKYTAIEIPNVVKENVNDENEEGTVVKNIGKAIFAGDSYAKSLTIPDGIEKIEEQAFSSCSNLTGTLEIPSSVTSIEGYTFTNCNKITEVRIPGSLNINGAEFVFCKKLNKLVIFDNPDKPDVIGTIAPRGFTYAESLKEVELSNTTTIGDSAFVGLDNLEKVTVSSHLGKNPNVATSIGSDAFADCQNLIEFEMPNSVTKLGNQIFGGEGKPKATKVKISNSLTDIPEMTFMSFTNLSEIEIPSSVTNIGMKAFLNCTSLQKINIPSSVTNIGMEAFFQCIGLQEATIAAKSVGYQSFAHCENLKNVTLQDSVENIDEQAFSECKSLTKINIPSSVTNLGNLAFYNCTSLQEITIPSSVTSIGYVAFYGCTSLQEITIPSSVTSIKNATFVGCSSLKKVTIPSSVNSIESSAFSGCTGLSDLAVPSSVTTIGKDAFKDVPHVIYNGTAEDGKHWGAKSFN